MRWVLLIAAIVAETIATMALRATVDHSLWVVLVVIGYISSYVLLGLALRSGMGIGVAYGIWAALGVVLTALMGSVLFAESMGPVSIAGIGLIVVGVIAIETGSIQPAAEKSPSEKSAP